MVLDVSSLEARLARTITAAQLFAFNFQRQPSTAYEQICFDAMSLRDDLFDFFSSPSPQCDHCLTDIGGGFIVVWQSEVIEVFHPNCARAVATHRVDIAESLLADARAADAGEVR
jgi:hypothetical protein